MIYVMIAFMEALTTLVQRTVCIQFFGKTDKAKWIDILTWSSFYVITNYVTYFLNTDFWMGNLLFFAAMFLLAESLLYKGSIKLKLLVISFVSFFSLSSELLTAWFLVGLGVDMQQIFRNSQSRLGAMLVSKLVWFAEIRFVLFLNQYRKNHIIFLTDWLETICVPFGSIAMALLLFDMNQGRMGWTGFLAMLMVFLLNLTTFYLYQRMQKLMAERIQQQFILKQEKNYIRQFAELENLWKSLRQFKHDAKRHYLLEAVYLKQGEYEKLRECYEEMLNALDYNEVSFTGNPYLDFLVSCKAETAAEKNIQMETELQIPYDVRMNEQDLYLMLGNLLDNAIEAASERILLKMKTEGKNLYLYLENDNKEKQVRQKEISNEHGLGLSIVKNIVEKYHGEIKMENKKGSFEVFLLLYDYFL